MATLTARRNVLIAVLRNISDLVRQIGVRSLVLFWVVIIGSIIASLTGVFGYLIFSGEAMRMLAQVMAWSCQSMGSCANFPAMLAGLAVGIVVMAVLGLVLFSSLMPVQTEEMSADDVSVVSLLLEWYRIGPRERGSLLEQLDASDIETPYAIRQMLYREHRDLEKMNGDD